MMKCLVIALIAVLVLDVVLQGRIIKMTGLV
jgi:hypothetical protein